MKLRRPHPTWRARHQAVLMAMLAHPFASRQEIAELTGYTRWQISRIVGSADFQIQFRNVTREAMVRTYQQTVDGNRSSE